MNNIAAKNNIDYVKEICDYLDLQKANDIISYNILQKSLVSNIIIAGANSSIHLHAIKNKLVDFIKDNFNEKCKIDGHDSNSWVIIDTGDIFINIFTKESREYYQLEKHWDEKAQIARMNSHSD